MKTQLLCLVTALLAFSVPAATFTVVNTNDTGAGSLRQAILDANATIGIPDTIEFTITNLTTTISLTSALPTITDPVTIDGYTQPGAAVNTSANAFNGVLPVRLAGNSAGSGANGLLITAGNSTVRGLMITGFAGSAGDGIELSGLGGNFIEGCVIGLDAAGTDQGNAGNGVFINGSSNNIVGGVALAARNVISGNNSDGVEINGALAVNNQVINNLIGTDQTGTVDLGNSANGIYILQSGGNTIGGSAAASGNLISGNNSDGIELSGASATNNAILGNWIGTSVGGLTGLANSANGVYITASSHNSLIGGVVAGQANIIAFNGADGISVATAVANTNNTFRGNAIFSNTGLGIDLGTSGITANDPGDADTGANQLQNFPVLSAATNTPGGTIIVGALNSQAGTTYAIDFYSNVAPDPLGSGEGQIYLGSTNVTTDGAGNHNFSASLPVVTLTGRYISATATDPFGNTSEFATNVIAASTLSGQTFTVVNTNDSGPGSLRQAILNANAAINVGDTIQFAITNLTTTISPASALPTIIDPVTIDGYTQPGAVVNTSPNAFNGVLPVRLSGTGAGSGANGLLITAGGSTVRGLMITGFLGSTGDGIELSGFGNNLIEGCIIGLDAAGGDQGNAGNGIFINGSSNNVVGGVALAARNVISGNNSDGIEISGALAQNNQVINNLIGTDQSGTVDRGNSANGVYVVLAGGNVVGGASTGSGNLISGNNGNGVILYGVTATNNVVWGNRIGTSVAGGTGLANGNGVIITVNSHDNLIGGVLAGQANVIAFNTGDGINVAAAAGNTNNTFRGNSIFSNGNLGIDLGAGGVTLNDPNDVDTGANQLQNYPVLSLATSNSPTAVSLSGSLASAANTSYIVDFYANENFKSLGFGEGQFYLGSQNLTTDGSGQVSFVANFVAPLPGRYLTATATDPYGNTSEFSRWVVISGPPQTNLYGGADFVFIIDATPSMASIIAAVKSGLGSFVAGLDTSEVDARFAIVLFGGAPELVLDFTTDQATTEAAFDLINVNGAVAGIQNNHAVNPEAGLEAIRIVLNGANTNVLLRNNVGGSGPLVFRPDARKNLILVTDENSDLPFYAENREAGQTGTEPPSVLTAPWQAEINATAQVVLANNAFLNLLISPTATPSKNQYGDPAQSVSDANFLNFNPTATLANLTTAGFGSSLEAQVLAGGLVGRAFNITSVNTTNFVENFFAAKIEEIVNNTPPPPRLHIATIPPAAVRLTWTTNSYGFLLETNRSLILTNGWNVFTTNYSIIGTNYAVTNSTGDALRFYRLRK